MIHSSEQYAIAEGKALVDQLGPPWTYKVWQKHDHWRVQASGRAGVAVVHLNGEWAAFYEAYPIEVGFSKVGPVEALASLRDRWAGIYQHWANINIDTDRGQK